MNVNKISLYEELLKKNRETYSKKNVPLSYFEIWTGQCCTLRCRDCCHMIPKVKQRIYDIDSLITDYSRVADVCDIECLSIVGGEPFTHPELIKLLRSVRDNSRITSGKIITNGTIKPDAETIKVLREIQGKLEIHIDGYRVNEKKALDFYEMMEKEGIHTRLSNFAAWKWRRLDPPEGVTYSRERTKENFEYCWDKTCVSLAEGILHSCFRGIVSEEVYGLPMNDYEDIRINSYKDPVELKARIATAVDRNIYKEYCMKCAGMNKYNLDIVEPGIQMGTS